MMFDAQRASAKLPESIFSPDIASKARPLLIATGYIHTIRTAFSGSSYFFAEAGMNNGTIDGIFAAQSQVRPDMALNVSAAAWKAKQALRRRKVGGYKFSRTFQDYIWKNNIRYVAGTDIIDNCQTRGRYFHEVADQLGITTYGYVDGTLTEYFGTYREFDCADIDDSTMDDAITDERLGYRNARHIIAMSERTRRSLMSDYGVPDDKISVVLPGANVNEALVSSVKGPTGYDRSEDFVLGFIGLYPLRKGLDRLAEAMTILRGRGHNVRLRVIGNCPPEILATPGVDYLGVINKTADPAKFGEALQGVHLGCQLSWAELFGIAMLEFLRFGIPILATDAGGLPDMVAGGGGVLVPREVTTQDLADALERIIIDERRYEALIAGARAQAVWATWDRASGEIAKILGQSAR